MTIRRTTLGGHTHEFASLSDLLAKATPARSGDVLAGVAAESQEQRVAAQYALAGVPLATFLVDVEAALWTLGAYALFLAYFALHSRHHLVASAPEEEFAALAAAQEELE